MSEQQSAEVGISGPKDPNIQSALFAQLVMQQTNMALMLLGKVAHPESGQTYKDLEAAKLMIDQLEMLETKTRGNLTKEESSLLKQSLMNLRLAFVEAVEENQPRKQNAPEQRDSAPSGSAQPAAAGPGATTAITDEEHRKKFSKKY